MLAVRGCADADGSAAVGTGLDAGALAVGLARRWADAGRDVLMVDADAHGTGLAGRIGTATRTAVDTAQRGLPSLMASRGSLSAETVAGHCWRLSARSGGSVLLLGAPGHPGGARRSAEWLAERADSVAGLGGRWAVVVSMPGCDAEPYAALTGAAALCVTLSPAPGTAPPGGLRAVLGAFWLRFGPDPVTLVRVVAASTPAACSADAAADSRAVGRIGPVGEPALLGGRGRRRDRSGLDAVGVVAERLRWLAGGPR